MDWDKLSVDGDTFQPKGDLLRTERKIDAVIQELQRIRRILEDKSETPTF